MLTPLDTKATRPPQPSHEFPSFLRKPFSCPLFPMRSYTLTRDCPTPSPPSWLSVKLFLLLPSQRPLGNQEVGRAEVPPEVCPLPGNQLSQQIGGSWVHSLPLLFAAGCVALEDLPSLSGPQSHLQMELIIPTEDSIRQQNPAYSTELGTPEVPFTLSSGLLQSSGLLSASASFSPWTEQN